MSLNCQREYTLFVAGLSDLSEVWCCGTAFDETITAYGLTFGVDDNHWEITDGTLPNGLILDYDDANGPSTNQLTGTPTTGGEFTFTLQITTPSGTSTSREYTICIVCATTDPAGPDADSFPDGVQNEAYTVTLEAPACATGPYSWQITAGALPTGLTLDEETGVISGTTTEFGDYSVTISLQTEAT